MSFFEKEDYTIDDIDQLIKDQIEESIHLDYKSARSLSKKDKQKNEIAKDVSAFANSDGGIIIYGVEEVDHVPTKKSFVNGNELTKEWLEQVIHGGCSSKSFKIKIFPIREDGDFEKTIYLVKVESHSGFPIMAGNKFYKRYDFSSVAMEEFEVRSQYFQNRVSQLKILDIDHQIVPHITSAGRITDFRFGFRFKVKNISPTIEKDYKIDVQIPRLMYLNSPNHSINKLDPFKKDDLENHYLFSFPSESSLFSGEEMPFNFKHLALNKRSTVEAMYNPIRLKLYYSGGSIEEEIDLKPLLFHEGKEINHLNFF